MPRYFFNVADAASRDLVKDSEGRIFSCVREARKEAVGFARDVVKHGFSWLNQTWVVIVTDENETQLLKIPLREIRDAQAPHMVRSARRRLARFQASFGPRTLAWLLTAALVGIIMQAELGPKLVTQENRPYRTASAASEHSTVAVRFAPQVSAAEINRFLDAYNASVVGGPRPGDFFRLRIADAILPPEELAKIVGRMGQDQIVDSAAALP
jgi:hypothetical protein